MVRKRTRLLSLFLLLALCAQALARQGASARKPSEEVRRASAALAGSVLVGGRTWDYLKGLADGFGGRLSGSPAYERSAETTFDTDHGHFMLAGVPALDMLVDMTHYEEIHHKAGDTLDKVNAHDLAAGAAVLAVTAYAIAEQPEPFAPRLEHKRVGEILKQAGIEEFLTSVGVWRP